jgi:ssDNA-binding Zn-finger/Zn-ribbon topoisomerase 1
MVATVLTLIGFIGAGLTKVLTKRAIDEFENDFDSDQLCYKLKRNAIICPKCSSSHFTQTFEEQMNDKWECPICSCKWYETHTHDIIKD